LDQVQLYLSGNGKRPLQTRPGPNESSAAAIPGVGSLFLQAQQTKHLIGFEPEKTRTTGVTAAMLS